MTSQGGWSCVQAQDCSTHQGEGEPNGSTNSEEAEHARHLGGRHRPVEHQRLLKGHDGYDFDFAGDEDRQHQSELQFAPLFNINLPQQWFVTLFPSSDIRINLMDDGKLFLPFNIMVGKMVTRSIVASVELGVPMVNDYEEVAEKLLARQSKAPIPGNMERRTK